MPVRAIDRGGPPLALTTLLAADPDREWSSDGEQEAHDAITGALRHVQDRMCAYCETPLPTGGGVEHVHPKSEPGCASRPSTNCHYDWNNLLLVCTSKDHCGGPKANMDLCADVLFPDVMQPLTPYFVINSLTGEIDVSPSLGGVDRTRARRAIDELHLNDPGLKGQRRGVIETLTREMHDSGNEALARHIAISRGGFLTTVESFLV